MYEGFKRERENEKCRKGVKEKRIEKKREKRREDVGSLLKRKEDKRGKYKEVVKERREDKGWRKNLKE